MSQSEWGPWVVVFILFWGFYLSYGGLKDIHEQSVSANQALARILVLLNEQAERDKRR